MGKSIEGKYCLSPSQITGSHVIFLSFLPTSAVLPESEHSCSPKQTSPRHNVYPTWTKEFVFPGLSRATLSEGGLEVILYDHHRLHRVNIGGIRLCVPRLKEPSPVLTQKSFQRDGSVILFGQAMKDGGERCLVNEIRPHTHTHTHTYTHTYTHMHNTQTYTLPLPIALV